MEEPSAADPEGPGRLGARDALRWAARRLEGAVASPRPEAEILVRHVLGSSRAELFARAGRALTAEQAERLAGLVERRRAHEPLQYLTGRQAFRRLELLVGPGVLVPRPETEMVVEQALELIAGVRGPVVVDACCGSGAIALSIATERPDSRVWATEVSDEAIAWARRNLDATGASNVTLVQGDLFAPLPGELRGSVDLAVANPPYLPESMLQTMPDDVRDHEPRIATVSGPTGLEVPKRIVDEAYGWLRPGGLLVMETWPGQAGRLRTLLAARYGDVAILADLAGALRVARGRRPGA